MLIALSLPADNDRGPQYMEQALAAIHQANPDRLPVDFCFGVHQKTAVLFCRFPPELAAIVSTQLAAHYPAATMQRVADDALAAPPGFVTWSAELCLTPDLFPIRRYPQFDDTLNRNIADPLTGILAAMAPDQHGRIHVSIVITVRPARTGRVRRTRNALPRLATPFFRNHQRLACWYALGCTSHWVSVRALAGVLASFATTPDHPAADPILTISPARAHDREDDLQAAADKMGRHLFESHVRLAVSVVPKDAARAKAHLRQMAGAFGQFTVPRMAEFHISGVRKVCSPGRLSGRGFLFPHGDLAEAILHGIPPHRTNDVVLFDAGDRAHPLAFNPLSCAEAEQQGLVASGVVSALKKLYGDSWGPRLEHILRNALLTLLEIPGSSLLSLQRLLSDSQSRKGIVARLSDPVVRTFWEKEFAAWKPQYQAEAVAPIQNKVGQFLSQPILRAIVGQGRTSLDLRRIRDDGHVLIVNLSKGRIGEDGSTLLGSLLVTSIQLAAMSRADVPERDRHDFALYVDEFQNFATESFATILSEARKYRLSLVLANQYLAQMDEATMDAVFGNVGSLLVFQVGAQDAEVLAEQLGGDVTPQDLMALPRYRAYARLLIDGMPSRPFSMETMPPPHAVGGRAEVVRRTSRHRYARPAAAVEQEIRQGLARA